MNDLIILTAAAAFLALLPASGWVARRLRRAPRHPREKCL